MAKTALSQLGEQIEAIRTEAFAAGYAAAMQSIRECAAKPASLAHARAAAAPQRARRGRPPAAPPAAPASRRRRARATPAAVAAPQRGRRAARPQRGTNARYVEEVLQSNAPRAL